MKLSTINEGIINEGGLSRVLSHVENNYFTVLTAFRGDYTLKQNRQRNADLEREFRAIGAGGIKLIGHWQEVPDGEWFGRNLSEINPELLTDTIEESYLVPMPKGMNNKDFLNWTVQTINKFNQDAAVFGTPGEIFLVDKAGDLISIGKGVKVDTIAQAYSTIKGKNFIFEGTMGPSSNAHRLLLQKRGIGWV